MGKWASSNFSLKAVSAFMKCKGSLSHPRNFSHWRASIYISKVIPHRLLNVYWTPITTFAYTSDKWKLDAKS